MAADVDQIVEEVSRTRRYTDGEDVVSAKSRKGHGWFYTGRRDGEMQLAGVRGFILEETLWLLRQKWPEGAVEEYLKGYSTVIHE